MRTRQNTYDGVDSELPRAAPTHSTGAVNAGRVARIQRSQRRDARPAAVTRALILWATLALLAPLAIGASSETLARIQLARQVAQTPRQNHAIQSDITRTNRAVSQAESPATIELRARAWGYARPGERPIVIAPPAR